MGEGPVGFASGIATDGAGGPCSDCGIPDLCAGKLATEGAFRTSQWGARWQEPGSDISRGGTGMGGGSDIQTLMHAPDPTRSATEPQSPMTPPATTWVRPDRGPTGGPSVATTEGTAVNKEMYHK
jgi:hypothetical protein